VPLNCVSGVRDLTIDYLRSHGFVEIFYHIRVAWPPVCPLFRTPAERDWIPTFTELVFFDCFSGI
jgi:hypothetical protein